MGNDADSDTLSVWHRCIFMLEEWDSGDGIIGDGKYCQHGSGKLSAKDVRDRQEGWGWGGSGRLTCLN
jgi:hypothetical protein